MQDATLRLFETPVAQLESNGFLIQERVFALVFTDLHTVADARYLSHFGFTPRCTELRGFAAKNFRTVEETVKSSAVFSLAPLLAVAHARAWSCFTAPKTRTKAEVLAVLGRLKADRSI
jgi:hypothetical protein